MKFDGDESGSGSHAAKEAKSSGRKPGRKAPVNAAPAKSRKKSRVSRDYEQEAIELMPHGISVSTSIGRPVLILKDRTTVEVLPVWMQPLDATVSMAELSHSAGATPHAVTRRLLEMMKVTVESCTFVDLIGHHQFVNLKIVSSAPVSGEGDEKFHMGTLRVRADEAMSFCLQARTKFFCSRALMARCRDLDGDLTTLEHNLNDGLLPALQTEMETSSKKQPYVM